MDHGDGLQASNVSGAPVDQPTSGNCDSVAPLDVVGDENSDRWAPKPQSSQESFGHDLSPLPSEEITEWPSKQPPRRPHIPSFITNLPLSYDSFMYALSFVISSLVKILVAILFVATKLGTESFDPLLWCTIRSSLGSMIVLPVFVIRWKKFVGIVRTKPKTLMGLPVLCACYSLAPLLMSYAAVYTTVSNVGLIGCITPIFSMVFSVALGHERLSIVAICALLVAFTGVLGILDLSSLRLSSGGDLAGVIIMIFNTISAAVYFEFSKIYHRLGYDTVILTTISFVGSSIFTFLLWLVTMPFNLLLADLPDFSSMGWDVLAAALYAGVIGTGVQWLVISWATSRLPTVVVAVENLLVSPLSMFFGVLIYNDPLDSDIVLNTAQVLLGLLLLVTRPVKAVRRAKAMAAESILTSEAGVDSEPELRSTTRSCSESPFNPDSNDSTDLGDPVPGTFVDPTLGSRSVGLAEAVRPDFMYPTLQAPDVAIDRE
ncbi:EamA-like transporter family [Carpediemonas membranifera]|uniref:EamA-like transporter family n=1 Tax=Carpediemonas membranifera TaxID=201153 RepID=A0A8J6E842_9EUKA|nr:EamA-like transporter family [Carpediemonas membranifera]|eukprot:KAG9391405.1 EamA-like transporter family [Carpediemonas membranifera]